MMNACTLQKKGRVILASPEHVQVKSNIIQGHRDICPQSGHSNNCRATKELLRGKPRASTMKNSRESHTDVFRQTFITNVEAPRLRGVSTRHFFELKKM